MAIVEQGRGTASPRAALPVPHALTAPDRAPKQRYLDPAFFELEADQLWARTWQMACRLEEIPERHDFTTYDILDQSIVLVRTDDGVAAFQNACRHRGVQVAVGRGTCDDG
ncbi:MAG TPA: Rieske 2Fe-2S domain-containing protein, partial [Acidimicrobiales bacterium]